MNSSVEGAGPTLPTPLPGTYGSSAAAAGGRWGGTAEGVAQPPFPPEPQPPLPPPVSAADLTLRDLVQQFAEESGVTFVPRFGRTHDGLQVRMLMGGGPLGSLASGSEGRVCKGKHNGYSFPSGQRHTYPIAVPFRSTHSPALASCWRTTPAWCERSSGTAGRRFRSRHCCSRPSCSESNRGFGSLTGIH